MKVFVLALSTSNYKSVIAALRTQDVDAVPLSVSEFKDLRDESLIIIPGVGNISHLCEEISCQISIADLSKLIALSRHYVIGICLGFQFMCKSSSENISSECLDLFPFNVSRINKFQELPSVGWKKIEKCLPLGNNLRLKSPQWGNILQSSYFYFTHSYAVLDIYSTNDCEVFKYMIGQQSVTASILLGRYIGFQFHPEKSGHSGLLLLKAVVDSIEADFLRSND
ncbi:imidazole glycerol phosphate synthase subunit HisH [Synechococcus sp. MU1617]|uniref:imidazole glycerol phosphate synthase subunit HisH n=1 Tax=Synechococcus sp. MU1617 TaxID=2508346 RepID=UPI001CF8CFF4|nr:imidazole glycerol phosphate synthase subunit HisH [Synechococcus sp. MU1617]MCB4389457.1 imidazole glycerol phosphate synthase subunit HisH [Synechococcus sp. MU1617]